MKTHEEKRSYSQTVKSTGLFGGVQSITLMVSLVKNKLIAVWLGSAGIGLISILNTITTLVGSLTNIGISSSAVREISEVSDSKIDLNFVVKKVRNWSFITGIAGTLLCMFLSPLLSKWTFGSYEYTTSIIILSPVIGFTAVSGGELAILKGIRKLRSIAVISVLGSVLVLFPSLILYYFIGIKGIIPSFLISAIIMTLLTLHYSFKFFPFRLSDLSAIYLKKGSTMLKVGFAMIFASILGSIVEYTIRVIMIKTSSVDMVGLYNAGYALIVTYAGMVFVAMGTDYFPRISAINKDTKQMTLLINQQIEIALLLIMPLVVILIIFSPLIIPLLYAKSFLPVIKMVQLAALNLIMRTFSWPIAYSILARGDSFLFLLQEFLYDLFFVLAFFIGYHYWGLAGTGISLSISGIFSVIVVYAIARKWYNYSISKDVFKISFCMLPFYLFTILISLSNLPTLPYYLSGSVCTLTCIGLSMYLLNKKTDILNNIFRKIFGK